MAGPPTTGSWLTIQMEKFLERRGQRGCFLLVCVANDCLRDVRDSTGNIHLQTRCCGIQP